MKYLIVLVPVLASCSSGPDPDVKSPAPYGRYLGAIELAKHPDAAAVRTLVRMLEDPDPLVRSGAVIALAKTGQRGVVQHLIPMRSPAVEKSTMVRGDACLALARVRDPEAVPPLLETLRSDPDPVVRRRAARALGSFGKKPEILKALVEALKDPDVSVAWRAHRSLQDLTSAKNIAMSPEGWSRYLKDRP